MKVIYPEPDLTHKHELPKWVSGCLAQCDCGIWFKAEAPSFADYQMVWLRVRWFNFKSKKRIRAYLEGALNE